MCSPRLHSVLTSTSGHHKASTHVWILFATGISPFDAMIAGGQVPCAEFLDAVQAVRPFVLEISMMLCVEE